MERLKIGRMEFGPSGTTAWLRSEKHSAQADAEREKNIADTLRLRIADLERDGAKLQGLNQRLAARVAELEKSQEAGKAPACGKCGQPTYPTRFRGPESA